MLDLLTLVVLLFVGSRLLSGTRLLGRPHVRAHIVEILRGFRLHHFLLCWPVLIAVIVAAYTLSSLPVLSWGWWSAIGGVGNPVFGSSERSAGTPLEWIVPVVFITLLVPALPLFAESEERTFRLGAENWSTGRRIARAVEFGLVHCLIGIPIGVGLALSIGGLYFTWAYLRGFHRDGTPYAAMMESTRSHLAYNLTIIGIVAVSFAFGV